MGGEENRSLLPRNLKFDRREKNTHIKMHTIMTWVVSGYRHFIPQRRSCFQLAEQLRRSDETSYDRYKEGQLCSTPLRLWSKIQ